MVDPKYGEKWKVERKKEIGKEKNSEDEAGARGEERGARREGKSVG